MPKILVVDHTNATLILRAELVREKHIIDCCGNGFDALGTILRHHYDLIILDWMVPGLTGLEVCKKFRDSGGTAPILMLTCRDNVEDRITGLDAGADDYMGKPFSPEELLARVRALLRRPPKLLPKHMRVGDVELDAVNRIVTRRGIPVKLMPREIALLELFIMNPTHCFSADSLIDRLWESNPISSEEAVRTHIKCLRSKLGRSIICTRRGVGYSLGQCEIKQHPRVRGQEVLHISNEDELLASTF
jgi:OmpR-family two-component system manganese-sensing response regulator